MIGKYRSAGAPGMGTVLAIVSVALIWVAGCIQPAGPASGRKTQALSPKEAKLQGMIDKDYTNPDLHCELAKYYEDTRQWDKARYHFNIAMDLDPAHTKSQAALISMLVKGGDSQEADRVAQRLQRQLGNSSYALDRLAAALAREGLDSYSLAFYNKALEVSPKSADAHKQLGLYYLAKGKKDLAKQSLQKSFELNPNQADVARELGRMGVVVKVAESVSPGQTMPSNSGQDR